MELFFSSIRSRLGYNNNPTAKQFISAFKRLLINQELKHVSSNCLAQDDTSILNVTSDVTSFINNNHNGIFPDGLTLLSSDEEEHPVDQDYSGSFSSLASSLVNDIVCYIVGYIVQKMVPSIKCNICITALTSASATTQALSLISFKDRGGLVYPSEDVIQICQQAEKICSRLMAATNNCPPQGCNIIQQMVDVIFCSLPPTIFSQLNDHLLDFDTFGTNHVFILTKEIIKRYLKIRMHDVIHRYNMSLCGSRIRQKLTKTILFKHQ